MSVAELGNWKLKYIVWYRLVELVFGNNVPHLTDEEIMNYVSNEDWMIVPIAGEKDKEDARQAQRPNLFLDLSDENSINVGITYDKLDSVERLREIMSPFNERERNEIIERLVALDDCFLTKVFRKTKRNYWAESPTYDETFVAHSNKMTHNQFVELFEIVDKIMDERQLLEKGKKYKLAPVINIVNVRINKDKNDFEKALLKIRPVYEVALKVRTQEEFEKEIIEHKTIVTVEKQEAFARYVEGLQEKLRKKMISAEEYRNLMMDYKKHQRST